MGFLDVKKRIFYSLYIVIIRFILITLYIIIFIIIVFGSCIIVHPGKYRFRDCELRLLLMLLVR